VTDSPEAEPHDGDRITDDDPR